MIQSGNYRRSSDAIEAVWTSLMPKNGYSETYNEDEEVMKLSLLLKSTQLLLSDLRQKQLTAVREAKVLRDELLAVKREKEQYETDAKNLQNQLSVVKFELQSIESKAKKFQKEAESATLKCQELHSKISSEVENRLKTMFQACLQQNIAVTVQDMMTQLHQETQHQVPESLNLNAELLEAKAQQVSDLTGKQKIKSQILPSHKILGDSSPDKSLILGTPDATKRSAFQKNKFVKNDIAKSKHIAAIMTSAASSPDEIAPTPPSAEEKQLNKKRSKTRSLFSNDVIDNRKDAIVYAQDTQDVSDPTSKQRSVLKENCNIIIPETLNQENCEEEIKQQPTSRRDKENGSGLSATGHCLKISPSGTSTHIESLSTPHKTQNQRETSPIFNSGSKKSGARSLSTSSSSSSKKRRLKSSSFQVANEAERSYRLTGLDGKVKRSIQPTLVGWGSGSSKLNSSKSNRSHSKLSLKGRHLFEADLSKTHFSEQDPRELSNSRSSQENSSHLTDDSDVTMFIPINPAPISERSHQISVKSPVNSRTSFQGRHDVKDHEGGYFEPMAASTEKDITPTKWKNTSKCLEETSKHPFKAPFTSTTKKQSNFKPLSPNSESQSNFRPPFASTQKGPLDSSALNELIDLLGEDNHDDTAPYRVDDSYDHAPRNNMNLEGKIRKKSDRKNLPALECTQCGRFFAAAFGDDENARKKVVHSCSRHRDRYGLGARPKTPPGWWNPGWNSPEDANRAQKV